MFCLAVAIWSAFKCVNWSIVCFACVLASATLSLPFNSFSFSWSLVNTWSTASLFAFEPLVGSVMLSAACNAWSTASFLSVDASV